MPAVFRPWISPYRDEDFEWNRRKSLETFADRDLVFEAARIVFRSTLLRRQNTPDGARRSLVSWCLASCTAM
jgi:hypothetical protein